MLFRHKLPTLMALITLLGAGLFNTAYAQEPLPVVATFSILGDMVENIGGDAVEVTTMVGRNGDTHVYQPTPTDAKAVKRASLMFTNGLEFEGWLERLAEAAEFDGTTVVTTDGLDVIAMEEHGDEHDDDHEGEKHEEDEHHEGDHEGEKHEEDEHHDGDHEDEKHEEDEHHDDEHSDAEGHDDENGHHDHHHGEFDPHGWLSLQNAIVYVDNITEALAKAMPDKASLFYQNRAAYLGKADSLNQEIKSRIAALPESARTIVTSHDAFQYFGREYGLTFLAPQGLSTESEASAKDVAELIEQIRDESIAAVFVENVADPRLLEQIARETGSAIGGKLFPGALSESDGPANTYLELMRHNATTIVDALSESKL